MLPAPLPEFRPEVAAYRALAALLESLAAVAEEEMEALRGGPRW